MELNNNLPLVTVITVVYNSVSTIEQTIQSVLNQSYQNVEYIIIDGNSTDGTTGVIAKYKDRLAYYVSEKDSGIYDAMNKGLAKSNGKLISILNSDDWYETEAIEKVVQHHQHNPNIDVIHGLLRFINEDGEPDLITGHYSNFLNRGMIEHPTCFIKKDLYNEVGAFNLFYRSAADYEWMLRARDSGAKFSMLPEVCTNFRRGGMSDSATGFLEELAIKRSKGIISTPRYLFWKMRTHLKSVIRI